MTKTHQFQVTGMACSHCEMSVREEVAQIPGVSSIEVSAQDGRLVVLSDGDVEDGAVIEAVTEAGYSALRIS